MSRASQRFPGLPPLVGGVFGGLSMWLFSNNYFCAGVGAVLVTVIFVVVLLELLTYVSRLVRERVAVRLAVAAAAGLSVGLLPPFRLTRAHAFEIATRNVVSPDGFEILSANCCYVGGPGDFELTVHFRAPRDRIERLGNTPGWGSDNDLRRVWLEQPRATPAELLSSASRASTVDALRYLPPLSDPVFLRTPLEPPHWPTYLLWDATTGLGVFVYVQG